jgi:hypothetical protein
MLSITSVLAIVVIVSIVTGIFVKKKIVRVAAWCVAGICVIGYVLFVVLIVPHLLQR